jgi:hypothetical protein
MRSNKKKYEKAEDSFRFEVGATYENMKGVYEVISIQNDAMVIRWEDGNEVATPMDLQKRIIERMAYEEKLRQQEEIENQLKAAKKQRRK